MRELEELEIKEIEFLEDFYTELNLQATKVDDMIYLRKNDNYESCIYVLKDVKDNKVALESIAWLGFNMRHPAIVSLYKDKWFDIDDFKELMEVDIRKLFFDREYSFAVNQEFKLKGINLQKVIDYNIDDEELYFIEAPVLYFSQGKRKFRAMFYTTEGMCPSGWSTASWGEYSFWEIEEFPKEFDLKPRNNNIIKIERAGSCDRNTFIVALGDLSLIYFDDDGGESYYPSGSADFYSFETDVLKKDFIINRRFNMKTFLSNITDFPISLDPNAGYEYEYEDEEEEDY